MKKSHVVKLGVILLSTGILSLSACSFQKKGETPEEVPSAGETQPMGVQPTPPAEAPAAPTAPTPPEAAQPAPAPTTPPPAQ